MNPAEAKALADQFTRGASIDSALESDESALIAADLYLAATKDDRHFFCALDLQIQRERF